MNILFSLLLLATLLPAQLLANTQQLRYRVIHKDKTVGEITATKTTSGSQVTYDISMSMTVRVVLDQDASYTINSVFSNGVLLKSTGQSKFNGKVQHNCLTVRKSNYYDISRDQRKSRLSKQILYSGAMLYFKEPTGIPLAYSEMNGLENKIVKKAPGYYILTEAKNGKQNKYWYRQGVLQRAEIDHAILDVAIERID